MVKKLCIIIFPNKRKKKLLIKKINKYLKEKKKYLCTKSNCAKYYVLVIQNKLTSNMVRLPAVYRSSRKKDDMIVRLSSVA
jgi:hypothetical protein